MVWRDRLGMILVGAVAAPVMVHALDAAAGHMVEALPPRDIGREVYDQHCLGCHGPDRLGVPQAPLDAAHMRPREVKAILARLRTPCKGNPRTPYADTLKVYEQVKVARYLQRETPDE